MKRINKLVPVSIMFFALLLSFSQVRAAGESKGEFDVNNFIMGHIADEYGWHIFTWKGHHVSLPLPVIVYSKQSGLNLFISSHLGHGGSYKGFYVSQQARHKGKLVELIEGEEVAPYNFSITKNVCSLFFSALLLLLIFIPAARKYKKNKNKAPSGLQSALEPLVVFVRDEIAIPYIGENKYMKYMPYLLTLFFFIWINNIMGLIQIPPFFGANLSGNIAFTGALALLTFLTTTFSGNKYYWKHILNPDVPWWLKPLMIPLEIIGMFTKPLSLMIRLFANITGGHIIVLSLICLIFILKNILVAPVSILFIIFLSLVELLIVAIQAYIFTMLSALYIGLATEEH